MDERPTDLSLLCSQARDLVSKGRVEDALTTASVYFQLGQPARALEWFGKAIDRDPNNALAYYNRATALLQTGDAEGAAADLRECLALGPDDAFKRLILDRLARITGA